MVDALLMALLFLTGVFLILLVLVQRGRGGGLAGAFGGLGGQSAFGTKAGDLFTRITIFTAAFWIILCAFSVKWFSDANRSIIAPGLGKSAAPAPASGGAQPETSGKAGATGAPPAADAKAAAPAGATPPADSAAPAADPGGSDQAK
jgi:preprotein translocase subunit SecG